MKLEMEKITVFDVVFEQILLIVRDYEQQDRGEVFIDREQGFRSANLALTA